METTWSLSSRLPTSIFSTKFFIDPPPYRSSTPHPVPPPVRGGKCGSAGGSARSDPDPSKFQPAFARGVGQGLDPAVVLEPAPVEDDRGDALLLRAAGDELPHLLGRAHVAPPLDLGLQVLVEGGCGAEGLRGIVVDHLRVDVGLAAEDGQARPRRGPVDLLPDPLVQPLADVLSGLDLHLVAPPAPAAVA